MMMMMMMMMKQAYCKGRFVDLPEKLKKTGVPCTMQFRQLQIVDSRPTSFSSCTRLHLSVDCT